MEDRFMFRFYDKRTGHMILFDDWVDKLDFVALMEGKNTIPMQCIGLKDRNGELMFEGDIVKCVYTGNFYSVVFDEGCYGYEDDDDFYGAWELPENNLIIIGNIYENPELLRNENE